MRRVRNFYRMMRESRNPPYYELDEHGRQRTTLEKRLFISRKGVFRLHGKRYVILNKDIRNHKLLITRAFIETLTDERFVHVSFYLFVASKLRLDSTKAVEYDYYWNAYRWIDELELI